MERDKNANATSISHNPRITGTTIMNASRNCCVMTVAKDKESVESDTLPGGTATRS
ncbi:hypothetical protein D3C72_2384680 [compost metagenome]